MATAIEIGATVTPEPPAPSHVLHSQCQSSGKCLEPAGSGMCPAQTPVEEAAPPVAS